MTEETTISRRSVAKGIAWAVPAVAVTAATPAYAVSPGETCETATITVTGCKDVAGGVKQYTVKFCFVNSCPAPITVTLQSFVKTGGSDANFYTTYDAATGAYSNPYVPTGSLTIPVGTQGACTAPVTLYSPNASGGVRLTYLVNPPGTPQIKDYTIPPSCP